MRGGAAPAPVVAVDGPSGAGKGTIAERLARRLGFHLLDSGALYRLVALASERAGVSVEDAEGLARIARGLAVEFRAGPPGEPVRPFLEGEDVSGAIRTETCGARASRVAAHPAVRAALLARQRAFRRAPGLVADGRDMGTVVFPDAVVKIFLEASPEERARRRHKQLIEQGVSVNLADLLADIAARDRRDRERAAAPLKAADGAVVIDTSGQDVEAVYSRVLGVVARGVDVPGEPGQQGS